MAFHNPSWASFSSKSRENILPTVELEPLEPPKEKYYAPRPPYADPATSRDPEEIVCNVVWCRTDAFEIWNNANIDLDLHLGSGQVAYPFTISYIHFLTRCKTAGFSARFLRI
jgi:hypothetical protein